MIYFIDRVGMLKKDELYMRAKVSLHYFKDLGILQSLEVFLFIFWKNMKVGKKPQKNHQSIHVCRFHVFQNIFM